MALNEKQEKIFSTVYSQNYAGNFFTVKTNRKPLLLFHMCVVLQLARSYPPQCHAEFEQQQFLREVSLY